MMICHLGGQVVAPHRRIDHLDGTRRVASAGLVLLVRAVRGMECFDVGCVSYSNFSPLPVAQHVADSFRDTSFSFWSYFRRCSSIESSALARDCLGLGHHSLQKIFFCSGFRAITEELSALCQLRVRQVSQPLR